MARLSDDGAEVTVLASHEEFWAAQALAVVAGYSVFNDITCRAAQKLTSQWTLGKNGDRSGPLGPLARAAEGVRVAGLSAQAQRLALEVAESFVRLLPPGPRAERMREIAAHLDETWFCWIGGHQPGDVFYYRLQSPVLIARGRPPLRRLPGLRHPQPFHVHTVLRTPYGNDYGRDWVRQWQEQQGRD